MQRPEWLNKKINFSDCLAVKKLLKDLNLNTVCQQAACPNIGECFRQRRATFLILGKVCTRMCGFCGIQKGKPENIDLSEPARIAKAVKYLKLNHTVITSVTRDDLRDGGAGVFVKTIEAIQEENKDVTIETLIPDFSLNRESIRKLTDVKPDIIAHNIETVPRLYAAVRQGADYIRSLTVLKMIKEFDSNAKTKSGIMLGLGEIKKEVLKVFADLAAVGCDFITVGQYLSPNSNHISVKEYISPQEFRDYKNKALNAGFKHVESGPYVRSSYSSVKI